MLSRRNIRVKVMQTLYSLDRMTATLQTDEAASILDKKIAQSRELLTYLVWFITEVARYAETDANRKASKHLPTEADLATNTKISGNELLWRILEEPTFIAAVKELKPSQRLDNDLLKRTYQKLTLSRDYKEYIDEQSRDKKREKKMLEFIFTDLLLPEENFIQHIEEHFINWEDDAEMMHAIVLSYLNKPGQYKFDEVLSKDKQMFAKDLLTTVIEKKEHLLSMIKPKLKNWDAERIAALDLIILEMGVAEFLYFETIPTKVTINEYIDLAKAYSTPQSGQFVNGLLDNIHKELEAENKIQKRNFKEIKPA